MSPSSEAGGSAGAVELIVETAAGPARVLVREPGGTRRRRPSGVLALGHGAGAGCETVDLQTVAGAAVSAGWRVLLVDQPWRVAGRRVAAPPPRLDEAWTTVLNDPQVRALIGAAALVVGGRSAGARVACRTAAAVAADAVLCLAFPLHPPGRPERSRATELVLAATTHPVLVVQGARDAFGSAEQVAQALAGQVAEPVVAAVGQPAVVAVPGDHGLKADPGAVAAAVTAWLATVVGAAPSTRVDQVRNVVGGTRR